MDYGFRKCNPKSSLVDFMKRKTTIFASIKRLWKFFSVKWKFRIAILIVFMFISGLAEMIALGSVVPFLAALTDSSAVLSYPFLSEILDLFDVNEEKELIVFFSTLFFLKCITKSKCQQKIIW